MQVKTKERILAHSEDSHRQTLSSLNHSKYVEAFLNNQLIYWLIIALITRCELQGGEVCPSPLPSDRSSSLSLQLQEREGELSRCRGENASLEHKSAQLNSQLQLQAG